MTLHLCPHKLKVRMENIGMLIRDFSESDFLHMLKWLTDGFRVIIL